MYYRKFYTNNTKFVIIKQKVFDNITQIKSQSQFRFDNNRNACRAANRRCKLTPLANHCNGVNAPGQRSTAPLFRLFRFPYRRLATFQRAFSRKSRGKLAGGLLKACINFREKTRPFRTAPYKRWLYVAVFIKIRDRMSRFRCDRVVTTYLSLLQIAQRRRMLKLFGLSRNRVTSCTKWRENALSY